MSRTTSARAALALVVVGVLLLAGCGGSSEGDSSQSTAVSAQGSEKAQDEVTRPKDGDVDSSPSADRGGAQGSATDPAAGSGPPGGGEGKHGERIKLPQGEPERAPSAAERANSAIADITLTSPDLQLSGGVSFLPPEFTCDGADRWPTLQWRGVPSGTAELVLFAMNVQPVADRLFFDWSVAGIDPDTDEIKSGTLPKGAVIGRNSFGKTAYEICPADTETYVFALYALPSQLGAEQGFEPHSLRQQVTEISHNVGLMAAAYVRR